MADLKGEVETVDVKTFSNQTVTIILQTRRGKKLEKFNVTNLFVAAADR